MNKVKRDNGIGRMLKSCELFTLAEGITSLNKNNVCLTRMQKRVYNGVEWAVFLAAGNSN
jgi:hypothetical protein